MENCLKYRESHNRFVWKICKSEEVCFKTTTNTLKHVFLLLILIKIFSLQMYLLYEVSRFSNPPCVNDNGQHATYCPHTLSHNWAVGTSLAKQCLGAFSVNVAIMEAY